MSGLRPALVALLLAAPAYANDGLTYSDAATQLCTEEATDQATLSTCIGRSADACMTDTPGGYSTAAMLGCFDRELAFWDALLNRTYQTLRHDAAANDMQSTGPSSADALREMQRAWIPFRDATCAYESAQWGGGTGAGPARISCLMHMTAQQAIYLSFTGMGN